jgi:putative redox protein
MSDTFTFTGSAGQTLAGSLERPVGDPRATAVFAHCFTCTRSSLAAVHVSRALAERGIATLRFDFTGLGQSGGAFADSHFSGNLADLAAAADALTRELAAPSLLVGHSLGGAAVIAAARNMASVRAVATIGAPFTVDHVLSHFEAGVRQAETQGQATIELGGGPLVIDRDFVAGMEGHDQAAALAELHRALLVLHSPLDATVGIANAGRIFDAARHPKSFVSLDDADHLLTRKTDARYAAAVIATWADRYLPPVAALPDDLAEGHVRVTGTEEKFLQHIEASGHRLVSDEPAAAGGGDAGPTPYDLLLAGLGSCTSMTIRMVATREDIPLEAVSVTLAHDRRHCDDCVADSAGAPPAKGGRIDVIRRTITLTGGLDAKQRARLLRAAELCPVHRTLTNAPVIETVLAE